MKMNENPETSHGRRGFLKSGLRTLILGGIVFVCGLLVRREIRAREGENSFARELSCRDCSECTGCIYTKPVGSKPDISIK